MGTHSFNVTRAPRRTGARPSSQWLPGTVELDEAQAEALALLADPRDSITGVYLWSNRWNQFVNKWTK